MPALFIAGTLDLVLGGRDKASLEGPMRLVAPKLQGIHLFPGAGHWIQQERPSEVNALLLEFLRSLEDVDTRKP